MNIYKILASLFVILLVSCNRTAPISEKHEEHEETGEAKFLYTTYSNEFELFAEADPFVVGNRANVLSHFTRLSDFKVAETGRITLSLTVNGKSVSQTLEQPVRKGIYSFDITPENSGKGILKYEISDSEGDKIITVPDVTVFNNQEDGTEASENAAVSKVNTAVFTKEQSWKIDFSTGCPTFEKFGQVIRTVALIEPYPLSEHIISAKTNGIVLISGKNLLEGMDVKSGQSLVTVSASDFADNNISVKFAEAASNFEKADADYKRARELSKDKIVSDKELAAAKNQYETAQTVFENLKKNFSPVGQNISSPVNGYLKQVFVKNGSYVEAGQPLMVVSQNKSLILTAEVPQKYLSLLPFLKTAVIRNNSNDSTYTLDSLNGKIVSFGKAANTDNFLIPVRVEVENKAGFIPGSFVELFLKTISNIPTLVVPNSALLEEQGLFSVWVQVTPELFEKREVRVGSTDGLNTEILKGIDGKDRIVTKGAVNIKLAQSTGALDAHAGHVH